MRLFATGCITGRMRSGTNFSLAFLSTRKDLAGTLLTFSFLSIDGLRKLGANISSEAAKAYFDTWCGIGRVLGVQPEVIPDSLEEAAELKSSPSRPTNLTSPRGAAASSRV